MQELTKKRWLDLCVEAAICEDPERLQELTDAILEILQQEKKQLQAPSKRLRTA